MADVLDRFSNNIRQKHRTELNQPPTADKNTHAQHMVNESKYRTCFMLDSIQKLQNGRTCNDGRDFTQDKKFSYSSEEKIFSWEVAIFEILWWWWCVCWGGGVVEKLTSWVPGFFNFWVLGTNIKNLPNRSGDDFNIT